MNRIVFPSVAQPNIRYVLYRNWSDSPCSPMGNRHISDSCTAFDTYGDGEVQHCNEWAVPRDGSRDYFVSLASWLVDHPQDAEIVAARLWPTCKGNELLKFLLSIKWKEGKRQYINVSERKVSSSDNKRHDKRWEELPEWANGTITAAAGLFFRGKDWAGPLERWCFLCELAAHTEESWRYYDHLEAAFGKQPESHDHNFVSALRLIGDHVIASRAADDAKRGGECFRHNLNNELAKESVSSLFRF